eukprot:6791261-Pyramimonas_sp.AAC.1
MSGVGSPQPTTEAPEHELWVLAAHRHLPRKTAFMKPYHISDVAGMPGLKKQASSSKGKPTKMDNFEIAMRGKSAAAN